MYVHMFVYMCVEGTCMFQVTCNSRNLLAQISGWNLEMPGDLTGFPIIPSLLCSVFCLLLSSSWQQWVGAMSASLVSVAFAQESSVGSGRQAQSIQPRSRYYFEKVACGHGKQCLDFLSWRSSLFLFVLKMWSSQEERRLYFLWVGHDLGHLELEVLWSITQQDPWETVNTPFWGEGCCGAHGPSGDSHKGLSLRILLNDQQLTREATPHRSCPWDLVT